jgi:hypothetical protein
MSKPYHLMTSAEKIAARIASNKEIEEKVAQGQASAPVVREFSRLGHAFLESLPDMDKGTEAAGLLKLGKMAKNRKP